MARESTIGSTFKLQTLPAAAAANITAITPGATTVITVAGTFAKGDFVQIQATTIPALDRKTPHRISATGTGTITIDTDTTGATVPGTIVGTVGEMAFVETCFSEFGIDSPAPSDIDVTTMCDTERRNVPGLASTGSATFGGPLDLTDTGQIALLNAYKDAKPRVMVWQTRGGQTGILYGVVSSFVGAPQGVEQAVTFSGSFQVQESPIYLPPLAP